MREDRTDQELRARFQMLREEEERGAVPFEHVLQSAVRGALPAPQRIRRWAPLVGAAAVAAALVLALGILPPRQRQTPIDLEAWSALTQWTASTDSLLESSGQRWGSAMITTPSDRWMGTVYVTKGQ